MSTNHYLYLTRPLLSPRWPGDAQMDGPRDVQIWYPDGSHHMGDIGG